MPAAGAALWIVLACLQAPDAPRPASIAGRVVDADSGRPIAGVVVTPAGSAVLTSAAAPLPPRALTNGQGEFVLRDLGEGTAFFTAAKSGYANATYKQRRPGGSGQGVRVDAGQRITGIEIRMWKHAAISGTVVDEAGDPAVGIRVQAFARWFVAGRKRFTPDAVGLTDDRGIYRIASLTPGDYTVGIISTQRTTPPEVMDIFFGASGASAELRARVSRELNAVHTAIVPPGSPHAVVVRDQMFTLPPGTLTLQAEADGALSIYPTMFYPVASSLAQASVVALRSGEERGSVDLQMRPVRAVRVSGTVVTSGGPASHVGVRLVPAPADDAVEAIEVATTITSASGAFAFPAVPSGQYVLTVLMPPRDPIDPHDDSRVTVTPGGTISIGTGVSPPIAGTGPPPVPADATLCAREPLSVGDTDVSNLVVALARGPRVSGRLEFEGTADRPAGAALTGIRINLDPADGSRLTDDGLAFQAGHPDEDGRFNTMGVPPGRYVLRVNPPGGWFVKGAFVGGIDLADVPFELAARDLSAVVITLTDRPASLSGVVRSSQGPDPDAIVLAYPTDAAGWASRGALPRRMRTARAQKDGTYIMTGLAAGEYNIVAVHENEFPDWQDPALLDALARVARQVRVGDGERRIADLAPAVIR
jgi:hypothetical protein